VLHRHSELLDVLERARDLGFLGAAPLARQVEHALGFALARAGVAESAPDGPARMADLGSGGGLPGLVLAAEWPAAEVVLVEAMRRRAAFLAEAAAGLAWSNLTVDARRAEELGRDPARRNLFDLVVARGFGPPAVVAECAAPLLGPEGLLVVSEPPEERQRWPESGLTELGLEMVGPFQAAARYVVLRQASECPDRYPRRTGVPLKRPLW